MTAVVIDESKDNDPDMRPDIAVNQRLDQYTEGERATRRTLCERLSGDVEGLTGCRAVAVPGPVPENVLNPDEVARGTQAYGGVKRDNEQEPA